MIFFSISEMVTAMKAVASMDVELTVEERNLLSVAYKNVIGARRASWRIISSIEQKEENKASEDKLKMIKTYRNQVIMTYHFFNTFCQILRFFCLILFRKSKKYGNYTNQKKNSHRNQYTCSGDLTKVRRKIEKKEIFQ